jgi:hypothetical protein
MDDGVTPILVSAHFRTFLPGSFKMVCHLKIPHSKRSFVNLRGGKRQEEESPGAVGGELGLREGIPVRKELEQLAISDWMIAQALANCSLALEGGMARDPSWWPARAGPSLPPMQPSFCPALGFLLPSEPSNEPRWAHGKQPTRNTRGKTNADSV